YDFVRERQGAFQQVAALSTNGAPYRITGNSTTGAQLLGYVVTTSTLFDVLGVRPLLGRTFSDADDRPGAAPTIVISYGMWQQDLGGDRNVIGRDIQLSGQSVTVIGVMPRDFFFPSPEFRAWRPLQLDPSTGPYHTNGSLTL